jgi:hypothetical protein
MNAIDKIRIATTDTAEAADLACLEISSALGLPVGVEFQEIEGACLILELRLGDEALPTSATFAPRGCYHQGRPEPSGPQRLEARFLPCSDSSIHPECPGEML